MANTDDLAQRIEHLRSEGYCILENVIPSDEVDALRDSVLATADSEAYNESRDFIGNNRDFPRYVGSERVLGSSRLHAGPVRPHRLHWPDHPSVT